MKDIIPADTLREIGKECIIAYEDITGFVKDRLVNSAEAADILNCSRQYIKQLSDKEKLSSVRAGAHSKLFLKSEIERED